VLVESELRICGREIVDIGTHIFTPHPCIG
jgi:hypothetical protein